MVALNRFENVICALWESIVYIYIYIYVFIFRVQKKIYMIIAEVHEAKINEGTKEDVLDLGER